MKLPITLTKLDKMKLFARGNPSKIAEYTVEKQKYDDLIKTYFNEEHPYAKSPADWYVTQLEEEAKTGDEAAIMRHMIINDRVDNNENHSDKSVDMRLAKIEILEKMQKGEELTKKDLNLAEEVARSYPNEENRVLFSKVKREFQNPTSDTSQEDLTEPTKITQKEVDVAYEKAKKTSRIEDRVAFTTIKREFEEQDAE